MSRPLIERIQGRLFLVKSVVPVTDLTSAMIAAGVKNKDNTFTRTTFSFSKANKSSEIYLAVNEFAKTHEEMQLYLKTQGFRFLNHSPSLLLGLPLREIFQATSSLKPYKITAAGELDCVVRRNTDGLPFFLEVRTGRDYSLSLGLKVVTISSGKPKAKYAANEIVLAQKL
jgi:hypothetical protein